MVRVSLLSLSILCSGAAASADPAVIEGVSARDSGSAWTFDVTLSHGDTGWDDYADGWRIEDSEGTVLGYRELLHPHVNEQPFTRSLSGVIIPSDLSTVEVRASTNADGWADSTLTFPLPGR